MDVTAAAGVIAGGSSPITGTGAGGEAKLGATGMGMLANCSADGANDDSILVIVPWSNPKPSNETFACCSCASIEPSSWSSQPPAVVSWLAAIK